MAQIDCTTIRWVQEEKAKRNARETCVCNYSATKKANNESLNEILSGIMWAIFIVGLFFIGMFV